MSSRDHFRAHSRRRVDLPAVLRDRGGTSAQGAKVRNLGLGGALVEVAEPNESGGAGAGLELDLQPDGAVTLEVTAPTLWDPLTLRGRVAWVRRGQPGGATHAGVRFEHRDAGSLYALFQLLGAHAYDA